MSTFDGASERAGHNVAPERTRNHLRLHSVDIYVRDQERSVQFYVNKLGFELAFDAQLHSGKRWVGVSPPDGTAILTLIEPEPNSCRMQIDR